MIRERERERERERARGRKRERGEGEYARETPIYLQKPLRLLGSIEKTFHSPIFFLLFSQYLVCDNYIYSTTLPKYVFQYMPHLL